MQTFKTGELMIVESSRFSWSPNEKTLTFDPSRLTTAEGRQSLLHELGHALLGHQKDQLQKHRDAMERDASEVGNQLGKLLGVS